jgi:hypothetical protein
MKINNPFETYSRGMTARERRIRSRWAFLFVMSSLVAIWSTVKSYNGEDDLEKERGINVVLQTQTVKMSNTIDSLRDEFFILSTVNGRYELTLDYLKEVNPNAHKQAQDFFDHQTE